MIRESHSNHGVVVNVSSAQQTIEDSFFSYCTEGNGHKLPYDIDEWRREARRRAYELPDEKLKSTLPQLGR